MNTNKGDYRTAEERGDAFVKRLSREFVHLSSDERQRLMAQAHKAYYEAEIIADDVGEYDTGLSIARKHEGLIKDMPDSYAKKKDFAEILDMMRREIRANKAHKLIEGDKARREGLEASMASASLAIISLIGGIFFLFLNFSTSNISLSPGITPFNWKLWLGVILILIGLVSGWFWIKKNKKK
jgi:hypothetical protein